MSFSLDQHILDKGAGGGRLLAPAVRPVLLARVVAGHRDMQLCELLG